MTLSQTTACSSLLPCFIDFENWCQSPYWKWHLPYFDYPALNSLSHLGASKEDPWISCCCWESLKFWGFCQRRYCCHLLIENSQKISCLFGKIDRVWSWYSYLAHRGSVDCWSSAIYCCFHCLSLLESAQWLIFLGLKLHCSSSEARATPRFVLFSYY